jgi:hypothetical protein
VRPFGIVCGNAYDMSITYFYKISRIAYENML